MDFVLASFRMCLHVELRDFFGLFRTRLLDFSFLSFLISEYKDLDEFICQARGFFDLPYLCTC